MATPAEIVSEMFGKIEEVISGQNDAFRTLKTSKATQIAALDGVTMKPREAAVRRIAQLLPTSAKEVGAVGETMVTAISPAEYKRRVDELQDLVTERTLEIFRALMPETDSFSIDEGDLRDLLEDELGKTGVAVAVEPQIWARAAQRIDDELVRSARDVAAMLAGRRFALPAAVQSNLATLTAQHSQDMRAESRADEITKKTDMELEHRKFVLGQMVRLRTAVIGAAVNLMRTVVRLATQSGEDVLAVERYNTDVHNLRVAYSDQWQEQWRWITHEGAKDRREAKAEQKKAQYDVAVRAAEATVKNFADEVKLLATQTAAVMNALHGSASVSGRSGMSVGYNYSNDTTDPAPTTTII